MGLNFSNYPSGMDGNNQPTVDKALRVVRKLRQNNLTDTNSSKKIDVLPSVGETGEDGLEVSGLTNEEHKVVGTVRGEFGMGDYFTADEFERYVIYFKEELAKLNHQDYVSGVMMDTVNSLFRKLADSMGNRLDVRIIKQHENSVDPKVMKLRRDKVDFENISKFGEDILVLDRAMAGLELAINRRLEVVTSKKSNMNGGADREFAAAEDLKKSFYSFLNSYFGEPNVMLALIIEPVTNFSNYCKYGYSGIDSIIEKSTGFGPDNKEGTNGRAGFIRGAFSLSREAIKAFYNSNMIFSNNFMGMASKISKLDRNVVIKRYSEFWETTVVRILTDIAWKSAARIRINSYPGLNPNNSKQPLDITERGIISEAIGNVFFLNSQVRKSMVHAGKDSYYNSVYDMIQKVSLGSIDKRTLIKVFFGDIGLESFEVIAKKNQ